FLGFARDEVAKEYPGVVVLTAQGTAGDVRLDDRDPMNPTRWINLYDDQVIFERDKNFGVRHGRSILQAMAQPTTPVSGRVRTSLNPAVMLPVEEADLQEIAAAADEKTETNPWRLRWGKNMYSKYIDKGIPLPRVVGPYAVR